MGQVINRYSFVWIAAALVIAVGALLLGRNPRWNDFLPLGVLVIALVVAWVILHPRQTPLTGDAHEVQAMIGQGRPVLLEFQSPY